MVTKYSQFEALTSRPKIGPLEKIEVSLNKAGDHFVITFRNLRKIIDRETGKEALYPCGQTSETRKFMGRFLEKQTLRSDYPTEKISVPVVDTSALVINSWPKTQAHFSVEAIAKVIELNIVVRQQRKAAAIIAKYKEQGIYENGHFQLSTKYPLATYQKVGLEASIIANNFALFMQQGTGKTAVDIARICNEAAAAAAEGKFYRAIVVCPKNVRYNWSKEIKKFASIEGDVTIIDGSQLDRGKTLVQALVRRTNGSKFSVVVMNYETVEKSEEHFQICKALLSQTENFDFHNGRLFDLGVLDESHYIKTPSAKRSKACLGLRDECKARMVLTGTPITNHPFDLYMQLEFLGKGWSGFSSFGAFKSFYGVFESGAMGYEKLTDLQNIPILKERLSRVSYQITKKEALPDLPDKVYDTYEVEMTAEQTKIYRDLVATIAAEIEMEEAAGKIKKELMVQHILTKLLRLAQVTSGFVGFSEVKDELTEEVLEEATQYVFPENPKIDALVEILKEKEPTDKTIIWACFVQDIKSIEARLKLEGIKCVTYYGATSTAAREAAVTAFNEDPETTVFLANPAAASTGLNLLGYPPGAGEDYDTNCNHVIYFSQNWSSDKRIQSEDRCHRRGTRENVRITELVVPRSIDTEIRERVEAKREMAEDVSDVQSVLANIISGMKGM